jgi:hypothetical protein
MSRHLILPVLLALAASLCAAEPGAKTSLPVTVYGDGAKGPWIPSGYMGDTGAIHMIAESTDNPHSGATALQVSFAKADGWGGVVWQHPHNDWGAQPGGFDLTGAKRLAFWARGVMGGEKVKCGFGVIGANQPYPDTAKGEIELTLTKEWTEYAVDVPAGADLTRIKTGFMWVVGGQGAPLAFFLDDIRWE